MRQAVLGWAVAWAALTSVGCRGYHYVALREAPLYAEARGERVLATVPRHHHEDLPGDPERDGGRVAVGYAGRSGWLERDAVRVFDYLHPTWDDGQDRQEVVRDELRELALAEVGADWPEEVRAAIRQDVVRVGFTREQVELAWGWPRTVQPGLAGGERWVYHVPSERRLRTWAEGWGWGTSWNWGWGTGPYFRSLWGWGQAWDGCSPGWQPVSVRIPVVEERTVVFDAGGLVLGVESRRLLDVD